MARSAVQDEWVEAEPPEWSVGDRMVKAREYRGIKSTAAMAKLLSVELGQEVSRSTVGGWERMAHQPTRGGIRHLDVVRAYSKILKVPESYFFARSRCRAVLAGQGQMELSFRPSPVLAVVK